MIVPAFPAKSGDTAPGEGPHRGIARQLLLSPGPGGDDSFRFAADMGASNVYMKDYYNLFVELSLQQCTQNDYVNKRKVKARNAASKKLNELQGEMMRNMSDDTLCALLNHEDDRVNVNAAAFCLNSEGLVARSILTLEKIIADSDDSAICFSAKMQLNKYR